MYVGVGSSTTGTTDPGTACSWEITVESVVSGSTGVELVRVVWFGLVLSTGFVVVPA